MNEFNTGIQEANAGSSSLVNGLNQLASGSSELTEGTGTLAEKSGEIAKGSSELVDGTNQLVDGTDTLQTSLKDASSEAGEVSASDETYEMVASPVDDKYRRSKCSTELWYRIYTLFLITWFICWGFNVFRLYFLLYKQR